MSKKTLTAKSFQASCGRKLFYHYQEGQGRPVLFLNGLSDAWQSWLPITEQLHSARPHLFVDLFGQGQSLTEELQQASDSSQNFVIPVSEQVRGLEELLVYLNIKEFSVVGFSYGGGVALALAKKFPTQISEIILLLPFILRLDLSFPLSRLWLAQYDFLKALTPKKLHRPLELLEQSYDHFVSNYMDYRFLKRIPDGPKRQAAIELAKGIMQFNSFESIPHLPPGKLILFTSGMDTLVPQSLYHEFWLRVPPALKRAWVHFTNGEHLVLEQDPASVAHWLDLALTNKLSGKQNVLLKKFEPGNQSANF